MIGDVLVCSILCNNLKRALPDTEIHYMVYESTAAVLQGNPYIDQLILFTEEERKSKRAFYRFLMQIRRERYDVLIDSYSKLESWLTSFFSKADRKISYRKPGRNFLYTDQVYTYDSPLSNLGLIIERRLSLLEPLDLVIDIDPIPKLFVSDHERMSATALFEEYELDPTRKTVMVSILGSSPIKTYPLTYMAELLDRLVAHTKVNILFNYIPNQKEEARSVFEACKPETKACIYFDLIGKNLREYIAIMDASDLIIGNDGGAINIAKALNKPSFTIFSPWIRKEMWATFDDDSFHRSVHLTEFEPHHFKGKSEQDLKNSSLALYTYFKPNYILDALNGFLSLNLSTRTRIDHQTFAKPLEKLQVALSILVIVKNEKKNLTSLLNNLDFGDELIVVDSNSDDGTKELMENRSGVRFIQKDFRSFSEQRNYALDQASNDWVLFVDADERVPKSLQFEILTALASDSQHVAYELYRQFYFGNKALKYGGFQSDRVVRLFNKTQARYNDQKLVHETLIINGSTGKFKSKLLHFSYSDTVSYKSKLDRYAELRAVELHKRKVRPNFWRTQFKPLYRKFYHYIVRRGFLDGKAGKTMAELHAYGVKQRYRALKKLINQP